VLSTTSVSVHQKAMNSTSSSPAVIPLNFLTILQSQVTVRQVCVWNTFSFCTFTLKGWSQVQLLWEKLNILIRTVLNEKTKVSNLVQFLPSLPTLSPISDCSLHFVDFSPTKVERFQIDLDTSSMSRHSGMCTANLNNCASALSSPLSSLFSR